MKLSKTSKFILVTLWIILSRSYDAYCTYQLTPDLSKEANPLVSLFNFNWTSLLVVIGLLLLYTIYAFYSSVFKGSEFLPAEKGLSFKEFGLFLYFGRKAKWSDLIYTLPKSFKRFNYYMGTFFTPVISFAGIVSTIMWLLINYTETYYGNYHSAAVIYTILIAGAIVIMIAKSKRLYEVYKIKQ